MRSPREDNSRTLRSMGMPGLGHDPDPAADALTDDRPAASATEEQRDRPMTTQPTERKIEEALHRVEQLRAKLYAAGDSSFLVHDARDRAYDLRMILQALSAAEAALEDAGRYTEAHERLDDLARERIAAAEAAEARTTRLQAVNERLVEIAKDAALFVQATLESSRVTLGAPLQFAAKGNLEALRTAISTAEEEKS